MRSFSRLPLALLFAIAAIVAVLQAFRIHRVRQLSALPSWSVDTPANVASVATGYSGNWRQQIVEDPVGRSQQWIALAQLTLHDGRWSLPHVDYDNAPYGRENRLPNAYRLWLTAVTWTDALLTGASTGRAAEHVALYADLLLQLLFCASTTGWIVRRWGVLAGVAAGTAMLTLYPFGGNFVPGTPQSEGFDHFCVLWSLLPIVAALTESSPKKRACLLFVAGFAGGIGLELSLLTQVSVLAGISIGAGFSFWLAGRNHREAALPWRWWGFGGAGAILGLQSMNPLFPDESLRLGTYLPLYAAGCLLLGEVLQQFTHAQGSTTPRKLSLRLVASVTLLAGLLGLVAAAATHEPPRISEDITASRLVYLQDGFATDNLRTWLGLEGSSSQLWATLLPAGLILAGIIYRSVRFRHGDPNREALLFVLGPLLVTLGIAGFLLRWWNTFDAVAIVALVTALAGRKPADAPGWIAGTILCTILGLVQLVPPKTTFGRGEFRVAELQALMERDLAQWIAQRQPDAVVLAPPALTTSLWYYGGIRGITTFDPANRDGLMGALHIAAAVTPQEAQVLLQRRKATHIVLPSWDLGLDRSARDISGSTKSLFIEQLRDWILPAWTRPVAPFAPPIEGFTDHSVVVLELGDEQSEAALVGEMASYFIDAGLPGHAKQLLPFARRFPHDLSAFVTVAEIERLLEDDSGFATAVTAIDPLLAAKADLRLDWERQVALAVVLAKAGRIAEAQQRGVKIYADATETDLRRLSPKALFRFLALGRSLDLRLTDQRLEELAIRLLPPEFRTQLK